MKITKEQARQIAKELCNPQLKFAKLQEEKFNNEVKALYEETIPEQIKNLASTYPEYFNFTDLINFRCIAIGLKYCYVRLNEEVVTDSAYAPVLSPSVEVAEKLLQMQSSYKEAKKNHRKLVSETESALLSLETCDEIINKFPEAAKFLPEPKAMTFIIDVDAVRGSLNKYSLISSS